MRLEQARCGPETRVRWNEAMVPLEQAARNEGQCTADGLRHAKLPVDQEGSQLEVGYLSVGQPCKPAASKQGRMMLEGAGIESGKG